jgi:hypothetical protein
MSLKVRRGLRQLVVHLRTGDATRVTVTVLLKGRIVSRATHTGSAGAGVRLTLKAPRRGRLVVRIRVFGPGGGTVRVVSVRARP